MLDILKQTGANFRLLPVRYPRPNMSLMGAAIQWLAANGAQLVMMPLAVKTAMIGQHFLRQPGSTQKYCLFFQLAIMAEI